VQNIAERGFVCEKVPFAWIISWHWYIKDALKVRETWIECQKGTVLLLKNNNFS